MKTEKELLDILKNENINTYKLNSKIEVDNLIELDTLEDLIRFANGNNINSIFYYYTYLDEYCLSIGEDDIKEFKIDEDVLPILQEEFDKYNEEVSKLDFSNPVELSIYCIYQGMTLFIEQDNSWYIKEGFYTPEIACKSIIENHLEEIKLETEKKADRIKTNRAELFQKLLNDSEFHKCTNMPLRRIYADKIIRKNIENIKLFWRETGGWYDISPEEFIEYVWREHKSSIKK